MYFSESRSAVALLLAMGVASSSVLAADSNFDGQLQAVFGGEPMLLAAAEGVGTSDVSQGAASGVQPKAAVGEAESAPATWGGALSVTPAVGSDPSTNASQQSVTAGYELAGSGITAPRTPVAGLIMTAPTKGRAVRFDNGIFIYPSAVVGLGYNDNVVGTTTNEVSSTIAVLRPEVVAEMKTQGDRYTMSYLGNYGRFISSSADDFQHHEFWLAGDNYVSTRARLGWGVGYQEKTDARGSTNTASSATPDRWHAPVIRALGIYGAPGSVGRVEVEGSMMQKRYENNRINTAGSDVDLATAAGRFFYRFMPKTSLVLEARNTWANYVLATSTGDNTDTRLYAGLVWEASAKTTGSIKLGQAYKKFDDASREDSSMPSWEGSVRWSPLTYSSFDLISSRAPSDSTGVGNFVLNSATTLVWNHKWASYFTSRVNAGYVKAEYDNSPRNDNTTNYGVGVFRELGTRMRLGLDWNFTERDSNQNVNDFKRNVMMLSLEAVL